MKNIMRLFNRPTESEIKFTPFVPPPPPLTKKAAIIKDLVEQAERWTNRGEIDVAKSIWEIIIEKSGEEILKSDTHKLKNNTGTTTLKKFDSTQLESILDKLRENNEQGRLQNINITSEDVEKTFDSFTVPGDLLFKRVVVTFNYIE